jgi:hypothetical protein
MRCTPWLLLLCSAVVHAADAPEDDSAALALPGAPVSTASTLRTTSLTLEGAQTWAVQSDGGVQQTQRISADVRYDSALAPGWRAVAAARLDADWAGRFNTVQEIATFKEAYVSWQPRATLLLDAGRINARQGVAYGYNPTDFFRRNAVRSVVSIDPNSLRDNRLGTVMVRAQQLWDNGSLSASYAPLLSEHANAAPLDPDLGATNASGRWLIAYSHPLADGWMPQWLAFGGEGQSPQLGMNLTTLLGQAMVAYAEVSGGRSSTLWAQAINLPQNDSLRARLASGLTYSTTNKLSLTVEYEYNGAGLGTDNWNAARLGTLALYRRYREYVLAQQELPTRSNLFLFATWQDLLVEHWDLTAFLREDLADHSRLSHVELRRHWNSVDVALRWQNAWGDATSDYGASPLHQTWQLIVDGHL